VSLRKYPRTHHVQGSRLQPGDEDLSAVPFAELRGKPLVVEEKVDGANCGVSFSAGGELQLQSRGHYLRGGAQEQQFAMLKAWAQRHRQALWETLGARYVLYGEWLYAKHTIFYDALPHYLLEYDVLDLEADGAEGRGAFLSTPSRRALLAGLPLTPVPVLASRPFERLSDLSGLVDRSAFKSPTWRARLDQVAGDEGQDPARVRLETDPDDAMEGLYIKWEDDGRVLGRYKWVRASFLTCVVDSGSHWMDRPILPNQLAPGADLFGEAPEPELA
jgi:RNA ligase